MARTTDTEVAKIFIVDTTVLTDMDPFILAANRLVTKFCSTDNYTEAELTEIETWLAAHFCSIKQKIAKSEKVDVLTESFEGQTGYGLKSSLYGQTAMRLDWAGGLANFDDAAHKGNKRTAGVTYMGKTPAVYTGDPLPGV